MHSTLEQLTKLLHILLLGRFSLEFEEDTILLLIKQVILLLLKRIILLKPVRALLQNFLDACKEWYQVDIELMNTYKQASNTLKQGI
jgi:hypothetical protein